MPLTPGAPAGGGHVGVPVLRRRLAALLTAVLAVALAACGSTAQVGLEGAAPGGGEQSGDVAFVDDGMSLDGSAVGGDGQPVGDADLGGQDAASAGDGGGGADGSADAPAGTAGAAGGSSGESSGGRGGGASSSGGRASSGAAPGLSRSTIKLGLEYSGDSSETNSTIGVDVSTGNPRANYETLIKYYNDRGGIAGRKIEPVYYEYSAMRDIGPQQQAACAHFTQDEPVYAVLMLQVTENYVNCLGRAGIAALGEQPISSADDEMFARYPGFFMPSTLSLTQVARLYGPAMQRAGFFEPEAVDGSTTVGLLTFDEPRYRRAATGPFTEGMRSVGQKAMIRYVHYAVTQDQVGQMSAEVSAAVLAFRRAGVDHVMIIEENALIAFTFTNAAEQQGYRPQYGINSTSGGQILIDLGLAPPEQMVNSRLVGWQPQFDLPSRFVDPWPAQQECLRMYKKAGIQFSDGNARGVGILSCAAFSFLKAALQAAPGPVTAGSFQAGAERLGGSWTSPWNKTTRFGPKRHYGTSQYLTAAYDRGCNCFKPQGRMRDIP
jgi:hypothetical protein